MRWPTVRLIWHRELRDLVRDRRWLFMLLGLPVLLYPVFGLVGLGFAYATLRQELTVGINDLENLPQPPSGSILSPAAEMSWLTAMPTVGGGIERLAGAAAGVLALRPLTADPPLVIQVGKQYQFVADFTDPSPESRPLKIVPIADNNREQLDTKQIQVLLHIPADFRAALARGDVAAIEVASRAGDDVSKLAMRRVLDILRTYRIALRQARFARSGLPPDFDQVLDIRDPDQNKPRLQRTADELRDSLVRFFPFMLVMWSLAGAIYPAVDLCAGEKERGTMETLLISPAERVEIVVGKFLAVWTLSAITAWWNLLWMGGGALLGGHLLGLHLIRPAGLLWCGLLTLPVAALFSAPCLALGAYARSTKEGQYYLLPVFVGTMPLVLFSLSPGIELNLATSLIPVTGVCLLVQNLIAPPAGATPWVYAPTVLLSLAVCIAIALRWAVWQFHREEVLFRESDGAGWRIRLRAWFRPPSPQRANRPHL